MPRRPGGLPVAWPLYALVYGLPLWWALGVHAFVWPLFAVPMAVHLLTGPRIRAPRGAGLLLLFLVWVLLSALQLDDVAGGLAFVYRAGLYVSAAVLLLFVVNLSPAQLSTPALAQAAGYLWVVTVLGGIAGLLLPGVGFTSVTEMVLPHAVTNDPFVYSLVHPEFSSESSLLGYDIPRPKAPFNYTNEWGSNFALTLPLAVYSFLVVRRTWWRVLIAVLLVPSVVPVVVSINRGLWISLGVAVLYVAARAAARGRVRLLVGLVSLVSLLVLGVVASPLGQVVTDRVARANLQGRTYLYQASARAALDSPILGHGAPIPSDDPGLTADASIGTHGQLWTVLVSQGVPGLVLLVGFLAVTLVLTWRVSRQALWAHAVLVVLLVQLPFYNFLPVQVHVVMIAIALCWRDVWRTRARRAAARDATGRESGGHDTTGPAAAARGPVGREPAVHSVAGVAGVAGSTAGPTAHRIS